MFAREKSSASPESIEAIAGLHEPSSGTILFENRPLDFFDYSTASALRKLLVAMIIIFSILDVGVVLITGSPIIFVLTIIRAFIFFVLILALKRRSKITVYYVMIASLLGVLASFGSFTATDLSLGSLTSIIVALIQLPFLIATFVLANRTIKEFKTSEKNEYEGLTPRKRKELGIGHIPEDRHRRGLLLDSDLEENAILGVHYRAPVSNGVFLNSSYIEKRTREIIENFDVRPPNPELAAKSLSGGNQQKLIIGREFGLNPKLLLVSQPTRGVDIGAIEFIHRKLIALRDAGSAVLLVSAELEEVTALADRLLVIYKGRFVGEVDPKTVSNEEIGLMMTGGKGRQEATAN
jgi:ABC-type branched-subunit amino acid transport system ATPase component